MSILSRIKETLTGALTPQKQLQRPDASSILRMVNQGAVQSQAQPVPKTNFTFKNVVIPGQEQTWNFGNGAPIQTPKAQTAVTANPIMVPKGYSYGQINGHAGWRDVTGQPAAIAPAPRVDPQPQWINRSKLQEIQSRRRVI